MANRPSLTTVASNGKYTATQLNANFQAIQTMFDSLIGRLGTAGSNNGLQGDLDMNGFTIRNAQIELDSVVLPSGVSTLNDMEGDVDLVAGTNITLNVDDVAGTVTINASGLSGAASAITFSPTGSIASTNVQSALAELDTEKASTTSLTTHTSDTSNPHSVTATQVGAIVSVDGVSNAGGNIDLIAGTNITITPDDTANTITIAAAGSVGEANTVSHVGGGAELYKTKSGVDLVFRTLIAGTNITVTQNTNDITIDAAGSVGEANTVSTVGTGSALYKTKTGIDLVFKSIIAQKGVSVTSNTNDLTLQAALNYYDAKHEGCAADGVTDDTTALQAALTAAGGSSTKKEVVMPAGTYIVSQITIPSGVTLTGLPGAKLKQKASTNAHLILLSTKNNVTIRNLEIDGNKSNQSNNNIGIRADTSSYAITIDNCYVHDTKAQGISFKDNADVANNVWSTIRNSRIESAATNGINIISSSRVRILSNIVRANTAYGIYVSVSSEGGGASYSLVNKYITIADNEISGNGQAGIAVPYDGDFTSYTTLPYTFSPFIPIYTQYLTITDNRIFGNTWHGIFAHAYDSKITDNIVRGNGVAGTIYYQGIGGGIQRGVVNNNIVLDNSGVGIDMGAATRVIVSDNIVGVNGVSGIEMAAVDTGTVTGNTLFDNWSVTNGSTLVTDATERGGIIVHYGSTASGTPFSRTPANITIDGNNVRAGTYQAYGVSVKDSATNIAMLGNDLLSSGTVATVYNNLTTRLARDYRIASLVRRSSDQAIPNNVGTDMTWNTSIYNDESIWSAGSPSRLTVPSGATRVKLNYNIEWDGNNPSSFAGDRTTAVRHYNSSGTLLAIYANIAAHAGSGSGVPSIQNGQTPIIEVTPGDYFVCRVSQTCGATLNVLYAVTISGTPYYPTYFNMEVVG